MVSSSRCPPASTKQGDCAEDRKSTRLNSSHVEISYAVFCLKKTNPVLLSVEVDRLKTLRHARRSEQCVDRHRIVGNDARVFFFKVGGAHENLPLSLTAPLSD